MLGAILVYDDVKANYERLLVLQERKYIDLKMTYEEEKDKHDETRSLLYQQLGLELIKSTEKESKDFKPIGGIESLSHRKSRLSQESYKKKLEQEKAKAV